MKKLMIILVMAVATSALAACNTSSCCACAEKTAWCEKCEVGHVDGKKVKCKGCFAVKTGEAKSCPDCKK
jgi:hypothetical protein